MRGNDLPLSVIITTHNQAHRVERCIRSVFEHPARGELEVIVVDDASQDATVEIVRSAFGGRAKIIEKQESAGWLNSILMGVETAHSEIVVFFDPDCEAEPEWLPTITSLFDAHPSLAMVTGPVSHGTRFLEKLAAISFHTSFVAHGRKVVEYILDDNWAARKDTIRDLLAQLPTQKNVYDGVGSALLSSLIQREGIPVLYEPRLEVHHRSPSTFRDYLEELKVLSAAISVQLRLLEPSFHGSRILRYPLLAGPLFALGKYMQELKVTCCFRHELGISLLEIPMLLWAAAIGKIWYCIGVVRQVLKIRY